MAEGNAASKASEESKRRGDRSLKKINNAVKTLAAQNPNKRVRLMFQDEAGFGRINKPKSCWCPNGIRPTVPCHHIREYRYAYGAVDPMDGASFFLVMPYCNTQCMQIFLHHLRLAYPEDIIALVCDGAAWHKSGKLKVRTQGFRNEVFPTLRKVVDRLCDTICHLSRNTIISITQRN